jgi:beta-lactamase regulating signal transducer with metallopeptidase domain
MEQFFIYMLQVNISLMVACLVYYFLLRNLTFFKLNRYYLIASIVLSAIVPYAVQQISFTDPSISGTINAYAPNWQAVQHNIKTVSINPQYTWKDLLLIAYWIGVASMASLFIIQIWSLFKIHKLAKNSEINPDIFISTASIHPFSFLKNIYINPSKHSDEDIDTIIHHERIHTNGWHSLDLILAEVNKIFFWFNPGAWFMKLAITENLEFIADQLVLQKGNDKKQYQYQLLKALVNKNVLNNSIANQFSFIQLKNRIKMMNKKNSAAYNRLRYALTIPMLAVVSLLFANKTAEVASIKEAFKYMITQDTIIKTAKTYTHIKVIENDKVHIATAYDEKGKEISKIDLRKANKEEIAAWDKKYGRIMNPAPPKAPRQPKQPVEPVEPIEGIAELPAMPPIPSMPEMNINIENEDEEGVSYDAKGYSYHYNNDCNCSEKDAEATIQNYNKSAHENFIKMQAKQAKLNGKMMQKSLKYQAEIQKQVMAYKDQELAAQMKELAKQQAELAKLQAELAKQQAALMLKVQKKSNGKSNQNIEVINEDAEDNGD